MVFIPLRAFGGSFEAHIPFWPSCSGPPHAAKIYLSNKSMSNAGRQKKNKNYFTQISGQCSALRVIKKIGRGDTQ